MSEIKQARAGVPVADDRAPRLAQTDLVAARRRLRNAAATARLELIP